MSSELTCASIWGENARPKFCRVQQGLEIILGRLRRPGVCGPGVKEQIWPLSGALATTESDWR
jgi:hypothetical protein